MITKRTTHHTTYETQTPETADFNALRANIVIGKPEGVVLSIYRPGAGYSYSGITLVAADIEMILELLSASGYVSSRLP